MNYAILNFLVHNWISISFSDADTQTCDLQRKLEILNGIMSTNDRTYYNKHSSDNNYMNTENYHLNHQYQSHDHQQPQQQHRQMQYMMNSGYSEDSDYTSDFNYPIAGQNPNSSVSQYRNFKTTQHSHKLPSTPNQHHHQKHHRSLETSRENSYEYYENTINSTVRDSSSVLDDYHGLNTGAIVHTNNSAMPYQHQQQSLTNKEFENSDPLFYNSRPPIRYVIYADILFSAFCL